MPSREEVAYFGAGPAPLPTPVLEAGARAFLNYNDSGLSLAEISHRSSEATGILADTRAALRQLLDIPDNYEILFMHGGGSAEFSAVVFNMVAVWVEKRRRRAMEELDGDEAKVLQRVKKEVAEGLKLDYALTGSWSLKASQEAAQLLEPLGDDHVNVAVDARKDSGGKFDNVPEEPWNLSADPALVYYCDNETVDGVEFPFSPECQGLSRKDPDDTVLVADVSSNFLSRKIDISKHAVIFGGAQKNIGITDTTILIIRSSILNTHPPPQFLHSVGIWSPPTILHWPTIAKHNSLYNTLPIFSVWLAGEVMRSLLHTHGAAGLSGQQGIAGRKAEMLYGTLEKYSEVYQVVPRREVRSRMNVCFRVNGGDAGAEKRFLAGAEERRLLGLKGHRSVGGIRASNYNAVPLNNVQLLTDYLIHFATTQ